MHLSNFPFYWKSKNMHMCLCTYTCIHIASTLHQSFSKFLTSVSHGQGIALDYEYFRVSWKNQINADIQIHYDNCCYRLVIGFFWGKENGYWPCHSVRMLYLPGKVKELAKERREFHVEGAAFSKDFRWENVSYLLGGGNLNYKSVIVEISL